MAVGQGRDLSPNKMILIFESLTKLKYVLKRLRRCPQLPTDPVGLNRHGNTTYDLQEHFYATLFL